MSDASNIKNIAIKILVDFLLCTISTEILLSLEATDWDLLMILLTGITIVYILKYIIIKSL
jgi:hypothetical protein